MRDAEEVKQHVFFKGIDWEKVLNKELEPPVPAVKEIPNSRIPHERIFGADLEITSEDRIKNWTFISE